MIKQADFNFCWANDTTFKDKWYGDKGLVIGRGSNNYKRNEQFDSFKGKKIGCNEAFKVTNLDALVWMDPSFYGQYEKELVLLSDTILRDTILFAVNPIAYTIHPKLMVFGLEAKQPERYSESFDSGFYPCELSGYIALNIALIMGLNPIWLYGFNPTESIIERSLKFKYISDWCIKNNRQVYLCEESSLSMFFDYKSLPLISKNKKKKEI